MQGDSRASIGLCPVAVLQASRIRCSCSREYPPPPHLPRGPLAGGVLLCTAKLMRWLRVQATRGWVTRQSSVGRVCPRSLALRRSPTLPFTSRCTARVSARSGALSNAMVSAGPCGGRKTRDRQGRDVESSISFLSFRGQMSPGLLVGACGFSMQRGWWSS